MELYVGSKMINAEPMTLGNYNTYRGWVLPVDENGADDGYIVEYLNSDGYISWSPKKVFEDAYSKSGGMSFGDAIMMLKVGFKMARAGWNGKGMSIVLVPGTENVVLKEGTPYHDAYGHELDGEAISILPHIDMYTVDSTGRRAMLPGWLASQSDMLAIDWTVVETVTKD